MKFYFGKHRPAQDQWGYFVKNDIAFFDRDNVVRLSNIPYITMDTWHGFVVQLEEKDMSAKRDAPLFYNKTAYFTWSNIRNMFIVFDHNCMLRSTQEYNVLDALRLFLGHEINKNNGGFMDRSISTFIHQNYENLERKMNLDYLVDYFELDWAENWDDIQR